MFLSLTSYLKSLTVRDVYLKLVLPILFVTALFFHKFAAVFIVFITFGLYLLKGSPVKKTIFSVIRSIPIQLLILFWIWSGVSLLWSINFENGILIWFKFLGMLALGTLIFSSVESIPCKKIHTIFFILSFAIIAIIISYLVMSTLECEFKKPLAYFLALFFFPTALYLVQSLPRNLIFFVFILFAFTLFAMKLSGAQSGFIGFSLGTLMFLITLFKPQHTTLFLKFFTFFWTLLTPIFMLIFNNTHLLVKYINFTGSSLYHRLCIWSFVTSKVFENPLLGWGLGSSKKFPDSDKKYFQYLTSEQLGLFDNLDEKSFILSFINMPLHPHNNALQVYLELGLVGGVLYSLFLASVFQLFPKTFKDKIVLATANGMAVLTLVIFNMSHSIWHMWLLSWIILSFAMLYAVSIYRTRKLESENQES